ncbi:MAG: hypothetical protein IKZ82_01605 [Clostridia bacterium]|nr:hypothetical protein [Clostridia bacterium]
MGTNAIVEILNKALGTWSHYLALIWDLLTTSPAEFKDGAIWSIMVNIHSGIKGIAYGLLVLFFVVGVMKTTTNFSELKRPEQALKLFLRFAIAKGIVTYSMDLMQAIFKIIQGIMNQIYASSGTVFDGNLELPNALRDKICSVGFFDSIPLWLVSLIGALLVAVLSCVILLTVYSRFFKLYMYTAIAPVPMAGFAGEGTSNIGRQFIKSYAGVCLQGAIIILACIIYSVFATSMPNVDSSASATSAVWSYLLELIVNLLVLVGAIRMSDRIIHEMIGM